MSQKQAQQTVECDQQTGSGSAPAAATKPARPAQKPKKLPPYRVLLHNDDVNTFEHIIRSILKLTTLTPQEAVLRTIEAHETGVALLLMTHRERAELYAEQFASLKVTTTVEPAEG
ncbi:MAG: ATP-dependent Clp protease adaptor ClpS [Planctomycetota bacterium]|jgi:ATP-dependent Clp protease adaptor protein ClpS